MAQRVLRAIPYILVGFVSVASASCAGSGNAAGPAGTMIPAATSGMGAIGTSEALPVLDEESGLEQYLEYAALNNAGLKAAFLKWKAALELASQADVPPDPRFTYAYFMQNVETRVGPQRHRFAIMQTFPWFGKLSLRKDKASERANALEAAYDARKLNLFYQVKEPFFEYAYLARAVDVTQENVDLLNFFERIARAKYVVGNMTQSAVTRVQVELGKLEDRLSTLNHMRAPIAAKLNAALNRPSQAELPWPKPVDDVSMEASDDELLAWLSKNNPDLRALDFQVNEAKVGMDLARKEYFPDLTLDVQWIETGEALNPAVEDSGKDPIIAGITFNLPIWYGKLNAGEREASARYYGSMEERSERENVLKADLEMALFRYRDAHRKLRLYRDSLIPKAKQSLEVTLQEFETGKGAVLDVIDAQRTLLQFELEVERARADRAQRLAQLEMLVGKQIPASSE